MNNLNLKAIPRKFHFLNQVDELPLLVRHGLRYMGVTEIKGKASHKDILRWAQNVGVQGIYINDDTAWCGLFIAQILKETGKPNPLTGWDILRALRYQAVGKPVPKKYAALGDLMIFNRPGGGHVGLYIGESDTTYFILGGNQGNRVSIIEIEKDRLIAVRRPVYINQPKGVKKYFLNSDGIISLNEA